MCHSPATTAANNTKKYNTGCQRDKITRDNNKIKDNRNKKSKKYTNEQLLSK